MNRQAAVIASFGTSVPEARSSITAVEEALSAAADGYTCLRAFTSPTIRRILKEQGEDIPGLTEALNRLAAKGVRHVIIQPTHLLYGCEYDKLKTEAEAVASHFTSLKTGRPLLADYGDIQRFARSLSLDHPPEAGTAAVFMGHGTDRAANEVYPAMQSALDLLGRGDLHISVMKGQPCLEDILRRLEPGGPQKIHLLPLMLVAGSHARNDMAVGWKPRLEQAGHTVTCSFTGLGQRSWVQEMYRERLAELLCDNK